MEEEKKKKIGTLQAGLMTGVAVLVDGLQALLTFLLIGIALNPVISIFAGLMFWLWFTIHGVSFISPKRAITFFGGFLLEVLPGFNAIPMWTISVSLTIVFANQESSFMSFGKIFGKLISKV